MNLQIKVWKIKIKKFQCGPNTLPYADDIHVFLSQLIRYSEVCSDRVNTHLEVDDSQHESVISYEILVAIYCC